MAEAWDVTDFTLDKILDQFRTTWMASQDFRFLLYRNDYTPVPGSGEGDYTEADFPGYARGEIAGGDWGSVSVTDHVAKTTSSVTMTYTADAGSWTPQVIFGYYVLDADDHYLWGERFSTPRTMAPSDIMNLTPEFRQRTYPYS